MSRKVSIGRKIQARRLELGLTQKRLAELVGVKRLSIINIEKGKFEPSKDRLFRLCKALKLEKIEVNNFEVKVSELAPRVASKPALAPQQLALNFGKKQVFEASSLLIEKSGSKLVLRAEFSAAV